MKASKNIIAASLRIGVPVLFLIALQSCGTYNSKTSEIENDLLTGNFDNAIANIDKNKFLQKDRNRLLYLLEKGKLEHLKGNYEASNNLLEEAYIMIDDKIKTNVGQAIAGKFTNPMAEPYKGEDFEKVTIHYYKALNYFQLGMPDEALVEAKRINIKLLEFNEKYSENKNKYTEDAFSQILQGILYESTGDINNAFIAYRNAEEIFNRDGGRFFGVAMPEQLKKDLLRTTKQLGFIQEHNDYRKKFNVDPDPVPVKKETAKKGKGKGKKEVKEEKIPEPVVVPQPTGEAVVFWENGLGPAKDQIVITASGGSGVFYGSYMDGEEFVEILIPIPPGTDIGSINAIAIPKYRKRDNYYSKAAIEVDGKEQVFELGQDFYPIAKQCLKDRMLRETINLVLRFATKKAGSAFLGALAEQALGSTAGQVTKLGADAAGAATEKADTRNWQSLPATISYARVPLKEGDNKFILRKYGPQGIDTDTLTIPYKKGLQIVNYFDLGRTQVVPVDPAALQGMVSMLADRKENSNSTVPSTTSSGNNSTSLGLFGGNATQQSTSTTTAVTQSPVSYKATPSGVTLLSVIDKYIAAIGGVEKVQGIKTQYMRATMTSSYKNTQQPTSSEVLVKISGNNSYSTVTMNGKNIMTSLINNEGAYTITERGKRKKMNKSVADVYRSNYRDIYETCMLPVQNGGTLEGVTNFGNEDAYAISFTDPASGVIITNFYSVNSGLIIGSASIVKAVGMKMYSTNLFSDYRNVNGVMFPFKMTSVNEYGTTEMVYNEVKFNEGVNDTDFQ
ncbi:hypothetical protein OGH69_02625 [Flavobacterium sp. MFBS3-15]|uniref:hypothetical protein n=1 Tax=Flavobacterium sp. MFBS3-15 TaxID=2989816 RepID=UPI0022365858|nr:hypothetical protein [Flavobacterium sp. MFBS3-15]MCW4467846.1 hypothetical protein [Flavobacterium sp. MFBS3-15]